MKDIQDSYKIRDFFKNENFLNVERFFNEYKYKSVEISKKLYFDELMQDFYAKGFLSQVILRLKEEYEDLN